MTLVLCVAAPMHAIRATPRHTRAAHAVSELLGKLRIDALFVGSVARSAWLGEAVEAGSVDVLAMMNAPQKNQLAMMASHRGFRVDRDEIDQSVELDLVPLHWIDEEGDVRVHVLLATNALYGRMMNAGQDATLEERAVRVPAREDLALLLLMAGEDDAFRSLAAQEGFDHATWQQRLSSIGLRQAATE